MVVMKIAPVSKHLLLSCILRGQILSQELISKSLLDSLSALNSLTIAIRMVINARTM